jgi:uncharacterized membrane protein
VEELFKRVAEWIALSVETVAVAIITYGAAEATLGTIKLISLRRAGTGQRKQVWLRFGFWLLLGLEFELAADIVRTTISPTWAALGQLGAIAVIRTFLNHFLEKDLEKYEPEQPVSEGSATSS